MCLATRRGGRRLAGSLASSGDYAGLIAYGKPFEADLVEHLVARHHDAVLDLGAGHADYPPGPLLGRVVAASSEHYVVLLLPSASHEKSARLLASRFTAEALLVIHAELYVYESGDEGAVGALHDLGRRLSLFATAQSGLEANQTEKCA